MTRAETRLNRVTTDQYPFRTKRKSPMIFEKLMQSLRFYYSLTSPLHCLGMKLLVLICFGLVLAGQPRTAEAYTVFTADLYSICNVKITLGNNMNTWDNATFYEGPLAKGQSITVPSGTPGRLTACAFTPLSNSNCSLGLNMLATCNSDLRPSDRQIRELRAPN